MEEEEQQNQEQQSLLSKEQKEELYTRVSPWVFYLVSILHFAFIIIVALFIRDVTNVGPSLLPCLVR